MSDTPPLPRLEDYSDAGFWRKATDFAKDIGKDVLRNSLYLYYVAQSEKCGPADKTIIYAALAYLISPLDVIPDLSPLIGYSDDAAILLAAIKVVYDHVDPDMKQKADTVLTRWF